MQTFFPIPVSSTAERRYGRLGLEICITLAPCSASKREAIGPAKTRVKSTTLIPDNGLLLSLMYTMLSAMTMLGFAPSLNYPDESPAYLTATMRAGSNKMDYLVNQWRDKLDGYIQKPCHLCKVQREANLPQEYIQ
jgi:hypothetical protein